MVLAGDGHSCPHCMHEYLVFNPVQRILTDHHRIYHV